MRILCRERLDRILDILDRQGGEETVRQFERRFSVACWEIEAAAASASRLKRRYDVRIARAWFYARVDGDISRDEPMPSTPRAIWQRLRDAGIWRVS